MLEKLLALDKELELGIVTSVVRCAGSGDGLGSLGAAPRFSMRKGPGESGKERGKLWYATVAIGDIRNMTHGIWTTNACDWTHYASLAGKDFR